MILLGTQSGRLYLMNYRLKKVIEIDLADKLRFQQILQKEANHTLLPGERSSEYDAFEELTHCHIGELASVTTPTDAPFSPITCLSNSTALDVVGVGRKDGTISFVNVRRGLILFTLRQANPVTAITFRTGLFLD